MFIYSPLKNCSLKYRSSAAEMGPGDTNYRTEVAISVGAREGDLLHLYYEDTFFRFNDWMCVTLRETESGRYQFVSNAGPGPPQPL